MKARELSCLGWMAATIVAAILFVQGPSNEVDRTNVSNVAKQENSNAFESLSNDAKLNESTEKRTTEQNQIGNHDLESAAYQKELLREQQQENDFNEEAEFTVQAQFESRDQAVETIKRKFRFLEGQYGTLTIDDIAKLEQSLDQIDQLGALEDLSVALDELLSEPF